ncbi:MAG: peptidase M10 [Ferruginibacter sp.]
MGIAEIDNERNTITIHAHLYFYGDAANEGLCLRIAEDINAHWNIPDGHAMISGKKYSVVFNVKGFYARGLRQSDVNDNDDPLNNYFRVEDVASGNISFVDGINSNTGYFQTDNLLNNSTTAAHEFGHTLGLVHPDDLDIRGYGVPGIMYPRGTICDPEFQYDPASVPLAPGGTMNPFHRRVLQSDIDGLHVERLLFNSNGLAVIGAFTSIWHYRHSSEAFA